MSYILVIFTFVGSWGYQTHGKVYDWRFLGEFKNQTACLHAAHQIGLKDANRFRCLPTDTAAMGKEAGK